MFCNCNLQIAFNFVQVIYHIAGMINICNSKDTGLEVYVCHQYVNLIYMFPNKFTQVMIKMTKVLPSVNLLPKCFSFYGLIAILSKM